MNGFIIDYELHKDSYLQNPREKTIVLLSECMDSYEKADVTNAAVNSTVLSHCEYRYPLCHSPKCSNRSTMQVLSQWPERCSFLT